MGLKPLEMIDRDFKHKLASCQVGYINQYLCVTTLLIELMCLLLQVGFLKSITCPCCELLVTALPHVDDLLRNAQ